MKKLTKNDSELLESLIKSEIELIEKGFMLSEFTGKVFLSNSINEFKNVHLKAKYGEIIPSMCTEYRYFVVGLLKSINDEYRSIAIREILLPTIGNASTEEILKFFEDTSLLDNLNISERYKG